MVLKGGVAKNNLLGESMRFHGGGGGGVEKIQEGGFDKKGVKKN